MGLIGSFIKRTVMERLVKRLMRRFAVSMACVKWPIRGHGMKMSSVFSIDE